MFKFLRKYNKIILAVGGTLLLIVFLIPQAIQQLSQQAALRSADIATVGVENESVSVVQWNRVQAETQIIQRLGLQLPPIGAIDSAQHWYLLTREAEQLGFVPPLPTGQYGFPQDVLEQIAANFTGVSPADVQTTIAKLQGVGRMINTFVQAGEMSDRRLQHFAQRLFHNVGVQTVPIVADAAKTNYMPSEQELREQLDQFGDVPPGEGERGFGYRLPDRVKVEWLTIPVESARQTIEQSDAMSGRQLRRHWSENQGQRDLPAVPEEPGPVPDVVRVDLLEQLTQEKLDQIEKFAYDQIRIPQRGLTRRGGFYVLPDDWTQQRVDMQALAAEIAERFEIDLPRYTAPGEQWLSSDELAGLEGIGQAQTNAFGSLATTLNAIVTHAKEFGGDGTLPIQEDVAGPPLRGPNGSLYLFRMVDTDPSRAPTSVDEVRDQLVADLRRQQHYEQLASEIDAIERLAREQGLLAVALQYDSEVAASRRIGLYDPDRYYIDSIMNQGLSAVPSNVPGLGTAPELLEQIIDWARTFELDVRFDSIPAAERTKAFASDDNFAIVVVRLTEQYPLTSEDFRELAANNQLEALLLNDELDNAEAVRDAFSLESMAARHNFTLNQTTTAEDLDDETAEGGQDDSAET